MAGTVATNDAVELVGRRTTITTTPTITAISAGGGYTCVRTSDGAAWCWGNNSDGQLGDGTTTQRLQGVRVTKAGGGNLTGVTSISAGGRRLGLRPDERRRRLVLGGQQNRAAR